LRQRKQSAEAETMTEPMGNRVGLLIALMMEAARTSETLVNFYQTTWRYNPEDRAIYVTFVVIQFVFTTKFIKSI
jgi:hypothetical protein